MSQHPQSDQFWRNIEAAPAPAIEASGQADATSLASIARDRDLFNKQNDAQLSGHLITTNQHSATSYSDSGDGPDSEKKKSEAYGRAMANIQMENLSTKLMADLGAATIKWAQTTRIDAHDDFIKASEKVTVSPSQIGYNKFGMPMTRAQIKWEDDKTGVCSQRLGAEDLMTNADGTYMMDASGFNYYNKHMQARMDAALDRAQESEKLIERMQNGEIDFTDLDEQTQVAVLKAQPDDVKQQTYKEAGFTDEQIARMETLVNEPDVPRTGVLRELNESRPLAYAAQPEITLNGGTIVPGQLSNTYMGAALHMKPLELENPPLAPVFSPQSAPQIAFGN